ncbi:MAG: hypothetical protein U0457_17460 [Candidatus Sericytochromatia bacterium]
MSGINNLGSTAPINSPYSPFDTSRQVQNFSQGTQQENAPYFSNDAYTVDNTSKAFDKAMARLMGKPIFDNPPSQTEGLRANQPTSPSLPANVSQEEINWALDLEQKAKNGYQPTQQETQAYANISNKLAAAQQQKTAPTSQTQQPQGLPAGISQQEVQWALDLENKIKGGYQPSDQEKQVHQALAQKLAAAQQQKTAPAQQTQQPQGLPAGVSQQEVQWALDLENKIKGGYQPSDQEKQVYQALAQKLAAAQQQQVAPAQQTQQPQGLPAGVSQQEVQWALDLENKIKGGYQPNDQEKQAYQALAQKLAAAQQQQVAPAQQTQQPQGLPAGVSQQEVQWALDLENKIKGGYQPNDQEKQAYQALAQKLASAQQEGIRTGNKVSQQEVQWALDLETKIKNSNYKPNAEETAKYQDIANRIQTQGLSNNAAQNNKDWQTWSQPFQVPRSLFQTAPRVIEVPSSLRNSAPKLPTYTGVNQGPTIQPTSQGGAPNKNEIDWALQLEKKVKTNYKPTQAEIAQYKDISDRLKSSYVA